MATTNEVSSNQLIDVLITDTLPGSAAKNSLLNPLSSSNSQNIGGSPLIADTKTQPIIEPEKLSNPNDTLNSKNAIAEPNSKKIDDSLIVSDTLKGGLSGSPSTSISQKTLSSSPGTDVKDTLTGSTKDAQLVVIKGDSITATDSLTNPQSVEKIASDKTPTTLAEKETKTEIAIAQNTSVAESKPATTTLATTETKSEIAIAPNTSVAESKPATTTLAEKETKTEIAIAPNTSVAESKPATTTLAEKETKTEIAIAPNTSVAESKPATTTLAEKETKTEIAIAPNTSVAESKPATTTLATTETKTEIAIAPNTSVAESKPATTTLATTETKTEIAIAQNTSVTESKPATTTLAEKETKTEIAIAQNTSVAESKPATTTLATTETKSEIAIAQNTSVAESKPTTSSEPIKSDKSTTEQPATTVADISKDSKQNSTSSSPESDKKVAEKTEVTAIETPKSTNTISPKPEILAANNPFVSGKFLVDSKGQVGIDFVFDGGLFQGELAIVSLKGMEKFLPGSEEFIKEMALRALSNSAKGHVVINDLIEGAKFTGNLLESNSNEGTYLGVKTFAMTPGEEFGVMLVPNGTVQEVLNNPAIGGSKRPLFSMATANPNQAFQVGQIADVTGDGNTFAMEDMRVDLGSDRDYNDFVFQVRGAKGNAVHLNDVINPDKDWRKTDMGKALIAYAKPYVELKVEPKKEDAKPVNNNGSGSVLDVPIPDVASASKDEDKKAIAPVSPGTESVSKTEVVTSDKAVTPAVKIEEDKKAIAPVSPGTESVSKTEVVTSDKAVTPAVKIEEDKKAIGPVSPGTESVSKTEVVTSDKAVTPAVKIEEDKKAIAPISPAAESVDKTEVVTSDKAVTPAVKIEEDKKAIAPISPAAESVDKTEVVTSDKAVTPAVKIEEDKKAIAPVSPAAESVDKTEVVTSDKAVTPAVKIEEDKKAIVPISPVVESVEKTAVVTSETSVAPVVKIEEDKKAIAPISPAAESVDKTEVVTSDKAVTPAVKIEEDKKAIVPISPAAESVEKTEVATSDKAVTPAVKIEEDKKAIAPISPATESVSKTEVVTSTKLTNEGSETGFLSTNTSSQPTDSVKNPVSSVAADQPSSETTLTETKTKTNTNQSTLETTNAQNPVILPNIEITQSNLNIPTNNPLSNLTPGVWTVDKTGQVSFDFLVDAGLYEGEIAIVNLSGMEQYPLNSDAFKQEAIKRALSSSELGHVVIRDRLEGARFSGEFGETNVNHGQYQGIKTFAMPPGAKFAVMLVPNSTVQEISESPSLWADKTPLFSIPAANPESQVMLADFTGNGNTFGWEDIPGNRGDRDFNDFIFAIDGATANVPELAANVNANTQWLESKAGQEILTKALLNDKPPAIKPVVDIALTPAQPTRIIDLSQVFVDPEASTLKYEVVEGNSPSLAVSLQGNNLQLTGLPQSGVTDVVIRATDAAGNSVIHNFAVTNSNLSTESITAVNTALTDFTKVINQNSQSFSEALSTDAAAESLENLATLLEQYPDALSLFNKPDSLAKLGISDSNIPTIKQLLQSPEVAAEFGLSVSLGEALSHPDSTGFDEFLLNADEAISLLPSDAQQPKIGFIDFTEGEHVQRVTSAFSSINSLANYDTFTVNSGDWAEQLRRFVDGVKESGENRAIANLSLDLSQLDDIGVTTRYELTPEEQAAIQYARENNVLLVVSAGNTGGMMSALGAASKIFDNIITVGAVNQFESKTDYSAYGKGLDLMAPGGSWSNDPNAFVGTSRSASYVTAAASLVWAANPALSLTQVKQLLIDTAADLNTPGWDETTGFGLIDVKEAIGRAQLIEPDLSGVKPVSFAPSPFSGEGRVETLARPTSEQTEKAIAILQNIQESLFEQWQTLADLGNPALTFADLDAQVKQKIAAALDTYQQVSTDAGITTAQAQQWAEAVALATQHYQIEKTRLQTLLQQQKELQKQLAALGQQKSALETETQKMLADIQKQIGVAESDLAKAQAKLTNPFADVDDNLQINPQPWQNAANNEEQSASNFSQQASFQNAEVQRYNEAANSINPTRWQVVGSTKGRCGRTNQVWGWGNDPNLLKQKTQLQLQGQISSQNVQVFQQLAQQADQQNAALTQYAQFLDTQQNLNVGNGNTNDANTVLELLKKQLADQENIAKNYQNLASLAEARRLQNQSSADWNNSQINRWQQVGTRRTGRSGRNTEPVYGWVHYPEHIAPRDQAQQLANQSAQERDIYQQLSYQSQQQVTVLREQVRKLSERVQDWPVLQQGIEYEITADELRLQAEKDLLALHTPVQQQKLETLNLQILQAEEQLQRLETQKIPTQQQATDLTENRLKETQTEVEAIQTKRAEAQKDLQNFLETAGFLLPYRERLAAVQKTVEQLEKEKFDVQSVMQQLVNLMLQTPSDSLRQQLNYWNDHLATLNQELDWAKLQQDQLALAIADSPERLAISGLIKELEGATTGGATTGGATTGGLPLQRYLDFLHNVEGSGANFLEGFDNLAQRLAVAKAEDTQTQKDLDKLNREYRELGLQKANLQDNLIPGKQKEIAPKEQQIAGTESAIAQTQGTLNNLQNQLTQTQDSLAQKSAEIQQQQGGIAATQSEITNLQNQLVGKNSEIQQQQSVAQGYQNQINQGNAVVNSLEQQRQAHQNAANYWSSQIPSWYWTYPPQWKAWVSWWWSGGAIQQAIANQNAYQAAANSYAQQRDAAQVNAQQLSATLQPQVATTQQQIATLQQQQQSLTQQQQALNSQLPNQQTQLQKLQKEQQAITQQANNLQSQINQTQNQLNGLNTQLGNQQQQRDVLIAQLAQLNQQKSDLEQKLIEKYREIELTDKYFEQVEAEVNRLQSRLDLLNKAGVLEQKYQQNWQSWQDTTQALATATQALLDIRKAGQPDRDRVALLQQQLNDSQANLAQAKSIQKTIADTQQSLEFTKLQLGNQTLLLQSLIDRDNPLAALERNYLNQAAAHQQKIWYWNGSSYAYNNAEAEAYRASLQQASFIADQRNRAWQQRQETLTKINELNQKISQQQSDIAQKQSELAGLGQSIPQIESKITTIQGEITTVTKRLEPLQVQENKQTQIIQGATTTTQNLASQLSQTTELHSTALRQLIGFGILASESDVDFFATQVEPQVNTQLEQLNNVGNDLGNQINSQNQQIANWEQELANTQDDVSKQALTNLIAQAKTQLGNLASLKASNQSNADELEGLLNQATEALTPLRQKQELEIRQKLESNDGRLESLQSQLNSENAADAAIKSGTVLDHVLLANQINQDLRLGATNWTEQFLAGNQQTKELVTQQQDLSNSVDELIAYINDNFAEPDGNYNRIHTALANGITTLGVVENRADELDTAFTSTEDAIERIKLRIEQDAKLWEEIAPIAMRYGAESQELKDYLQTPGDAKTRRAAFLAKYPDNGTAIDLLKAATLEGKNPTQEISNLLKNPSADVLLNAAAVEGRNPNQSLFDKAKAEQASHEAQGYALLNQAAWYEQQAAYNWAVSRKNGPYWYEQRWVRGRSGRGHTETITHVDYNWILWQQYSQIFPQLRAQGSAHLVEADKWRKEKERIEPLKNQWVAANDAANQAEPPIDEARNFYAELETAHQSIPGDKVQLASLESLLPNIQKLLEEAEAEAAAQNAKVQQEWEEYDTNSEEYRAAIADILQRRGELNTKAIETQQQLADAEGTVERQTVALSDELASTKSLSVSLENQRKALQNQIITLQNQGVTGEALDNLNTNLVQINQSLKWLNNKAAVLTAEQTALTQKRTMLTAQNEVILAEQRLLDAYINDPDADYSNLQQQLDDARAALAEAQRLAEQAEAASQALTASLQQLKTDLLAQNDEHLKAAKEHQTILKALVEATQSNANYTLQAAQKQQEVNTLEFQILQRLQTATAAGNQEAKALLDVAQRNDMATAAELYYRDYKDLAGDRGGCAGGAGNANDQILADRYYVEMLNNRELQRRAQAQADAFGAARRTAEAQMKTLQTQQETAQQLLNDLNAKVAETQEEREKKEQELAIAQARLDGITRIREQTEQTFIQLVTLEKLNLAQAQLEQEIAQSHQAEIDEAVQERMERDRLELERKRLETTAKIEQLKQLQAEDDLRQKLNNVRGDLGLATLDPTEDPMQLQTQLAGLLTSLKDLETQQPDLPDNVKALLAEARDDINLALQGKKAANIQESLLSAMDGMIGQIESYKGEINKIDLEEQWDNQLLQTAQTDLQGASQQFLKELQRAEELSGEKQIINPLYEEVLNKIALAEQAVEISSDLAKQGKEMLDQIIEQRIEQRKFRKKMFWNKILGIISQVAGILSTVLMILSPAFPALIPFSIGLGAVSGAINTIQAVINGDWMGAIFSGVMTGLSAVTGGMTQALGESAKAVMMMKTLQAVVSGAFNGARSIMSGESIMGFLQILGSVASAASAGMSSFINQCSAPLQKVMLSVVQSLQQAPQMIYSGIKSIQSGDWLNAIGNFFNGALAIGQSFAGNFNKAVAGILEKVSNVGNTALYLGNAIKDGGIEGWLSGLNGILGLWKNDLMGMVDKISGKEECECPPQPECDPCAEEESEDDLLSLDDETSENQDENFSSTDPETEESQSFQEWLDWWINEPSGYLVAKETQLDEFGNPTSVTDIGYGSGGTLNDQEGNQQPEIILKGEITSGNSTSGNSYEYEIKAGDTLWDIAEKELGDGNRWHELQKADGSTFTKEEALHLEIGEHLYLAQGVSVPSTAIYSSSSNGNDTSTSTQTTNSGKKQVGWTIVGGTSSNITGEDFGPGQGSDATFGDKIKTMKSLQTQEENHYKFWFKQSINSGLISHPKLSQKLTSRFLEGKGGTLVHGPNDELSRMVKNSPEFQKFIRTIANDVNHQIHKQASNGDVDVNKIYIEKVPGLGFRLVNDRLYSSLGTGLVLESVIPGGLWIPPALAEVENIALKAALGGIQGSEILMKDFKVSKQNVYSSVLRVVLYDDFGVSDFDKNRKMGPFPFPGLDAMWNLQHRTTKYKPFVNKVIIDVPITGKL
ncbi:MAG: DUF4114 domain-containing protein [Microcoleus sp.]